MEPNDRFAEDRGVSPIVGGILVAVLTLVLLALVGVFVVGVDRGPPDPPDAEFDFEWDGTDLRITHEGSEAFTADNTGESGACSGESGLGITVDEDDVTDGCWAAGVVPGSTFVVGDRNADAAVELESGETVGVVWQPSGGNSTQVLARFVIP